MKPRYAFEVPVYADCISPDVFAGKSLEEISALGILEGNKQRVLRDVFDIQFEVENPQEGITIEIGGDLRKVRMIGAKMSHGRIVVEGDAGMHLGELMTGGEIVVNGSVDSWAGCMMEGGRIKVTGSAGDYVGAPYRGSTRGMKDGKIVIHGDAGNEVGCRMRGGIIKVDGNVGDFAGIHMTDGTIFVQGDCTGRAGAGMLDGKIVISGRVPAVLPTFAVDSIRSDTRIEGERVVGPFYCFVGDIADNGKGKLFVSKAKNLHLSSCEKYL
ncbi:MAG: formylmethanofuran dehydrogenase subunit C [Candidatus Bathyarchaeota archaeon]|nr:formylmethanofuran dehydrogenase subunit C [Candidatus Bathyarchaeota archaeon]